jgi:1,4-dihydroxy-6-naphthoate synthase
VAFDVAKADVTMSSPLTAKAGTLPPKVLELKLAHSPDSDDAFMFYGLATKKISSGYLRFTHVLEDIETLNRKALDGVYDITAISFHGYAHIADAYLLLPCGASFGDRYGPIVVARGALGPEGMRGKRVAVPGKLTTASLTLQLYEPDVELLYTPFDRILERVTEGEADAGVVIHEGQLTYARVGLTKIVDLGEWWHQETGMPLPLGGNAIRRSLGGEAIGRVAKLVKQSIQYGLDHRQEALTYALQFSRGLDVVTADRFVTMYVNERTLQYSEQDRQAVQTLLDRGFEKGLLSRRVKAEFVE